MKVDDIEMIAEALSCNYSPYCKVNPAAFIEFFQFIFQLTFVADSIDF